MIWTLAESTATSDPPPRKGSGSTRWTRNGGEKLAFRRRREFPPEPPGRPPAVERYKTVFFFVANDEVK